MSSVRKNVRIARPDPWEPKPVPYDAQFVAITIEKGGLKVGPSCALAQLPRIRDNTKDATIRLFVVETGVSTATLKHHTELPAYFINAHLQDGNTLHILTGHQEEAKTLSERWFRLVSQHPQRYQDEQRIRVKKSHDVDTVEDWDPVDLILNHRRHYSWPDNPLRSYDLIDGDVNGSGTLLNAAKECVSFFRCPDVKEGAHPCTAFILVDPLRHHRLFHVKYGEDETKDRSEEEFAPCFIGDRRHLERFGTIIKAIFHKSSLESDKTPTAYLDDLVQNVIAQMVYEDLASVLESMNGSLDKIESVLHDNEILQHSVADWRVQLGRWRIILFHQDRSLRKIIKALDTNRKIASYTAIDPERLLEGHLEALEDDLKQIRDRIENMFQGLMAAMNIVESERAIVQAETVSKLTNLAFFFIPLTLVSTVFGMEINVRDRSYTSMKELNRYN